MFLRLWATAPNSTRLTKYVHWGYGLTYDIPSPKDQCLYKTFYGTLLPIIFRHGSSNHFKIETKVMPKHSVCNSSEYIDLLKGILCNSFKHIYSITQRHYMIFVPKSKPLIKTLLTPLLKRSYVIVIPLSKCHASWLISQQKWSLIFKNDK